MKLCLFGDARSAHLPRLARGCSALGARVHVVTHKPAEIEGVTVERFRIPAPGLTNPRRWEARRTRYLRSFLRDFDVVNVQFLSDWGFTPELIEQGCFVATPWGSDIVTPPNEGTPLPELQAARVMMLQQASAITACGAHFARVTADYADIDPSRVDVLPFGVDLDLFDRDRLSPVSSSRTQEDVSNTVGFFKGFRAVYGPLTLIRAIPHILRHVPQTRFEFVGDGPQLEECQSLTRELGADNAVSWHPRCDPREIPNWLARWDISVIPSVHESFGVAALESSAMGVPVVASDVCGLRDTVIDGETGRLVPQGDSRALADAVVVFLLDPGMRRRSGIAGRAFVERNFGATAVHRQWLQLFEHVREKRAVMV